MGAGGDSSQPHDHDRHEPEADDRCRMSAAVRDQDEQAADGYSHSSDVTTREPRRDEQVETLGAEGPRPINHQLDQGGRQLGDDDQCHKAHGLGK